MSHLLPVANNNTMLPAAMAEIVEHLPVGIIVVGNDMRINYVNAAISTTFSQTKEQLHGLLLWDAFPGLRGTIFEETYHHIKQTGTPVEFAAEYSPLRLWLEIHATPSAEGMIISITNVSPKKRLEQIRRASEANLNAFLDATPDAAILLNCNGEVLAANQLAVARMNTTVEKLIGSDGYASLPTEIADSLRKRNDQVIFNYQPKTFEDYVNNQYFENTVVPLKNDQGLISLIAIFSRDITDRKRQEADLLAAFAAANEERNRLAAVMEVLPIGVVITDIKGGIISSNGMDERIWGKRPPTKSLADYSTYQAWWVADDRPVAPEEWASSLTIRTGEAIVGQLLKIKCFDGSFKIILNSAAPIKNSTGAIIGSAVAIEDITALHAAQQSLEHDRVLLATIIDHLPIPVALITPQGELFNSSDSFRALLHRHRMNDIRELNFLDPLSKLPVPWQETPFAKALQEKSVSYQELILQSPNDEATPIMLGAAPMIINDQIAAVVAILQDISSLKELDHAKDEFLAVLSHELQTPLTSILGYLELAQENDTLAMYQKTIPVIQRNSKRLARMVNELLEMSKLLQGCPDCYPIAIDLCQLAEHTSKKLHATIQQAGLEITFHSSPQALPVYVDEQSIAFCIEHLISNSIKFTPAGGKIAITCEALPQSMQVTITDSGRGIAPELLSDLFRPFHQITRDETAGGLGLGLAIIHGYINWHGGTISAQSAGINHGSSFIINLPIASPDTERMIKQRL